MSLIYACLVFSAASCTSGGQPDAPRLAQLTPPPAGKETPVAAVAPIPTPMDAFRALAPPEGIKFTPLFAAPVKDTDARLNRLEHSVQSLRNDFDTVVPTLVRLVAVEKDMKSLVAQLHTLTGQNQQAVAAAPLPPEATGPPPVAIPEPVMSSTLPQPAKAEATAAKPVPAAPAKPAAVKTPEQQEKQTPSNAPPAAGGGAAPMPAAGAQKASAPASPEAGPEGNQPPAGAASLPLQSLPMNNKAVAPAHPTAVSIVRDVRAGDHGGVTHLVIEMTAKAAYTASLMEDSRSLLVELPDASWTAKPSAAIRSSALVSGYKYKNGQLLVELAAPAVMKGKQFLPPEGRQGYRLVIDLVPVKH